MRLYIGQRKGTAEAFQQPAIPFVLKICCTIKGPFQNDLLRYDINQFSRDNNYFNNFLAGSHFLDLGLIQGNFL